MENGCFQSHTRARLRQSLSEDRPPAPDPWSWIIEIGQHERAFNTLQATYRALASTWLLATFGAIGYLWSLKASPVPIEIVTLFIGIAGAVGITLIWLLDLVVYHRLLEAVFWAGLAVELEHPEIPPVRLHMYALTAVTPKVKKVYLAMLAAPLLIATFALTVSAGRLVSGSEPIGLILGVVGSTGWLVLVDRRTESNRSEVQSHFAPLGVRADHREKQLQSDWAKPSGTN